MWLNDFYHSLNPIAFSFGFFAIRWYALAYIAGFISAGYLMYRLSRTWHDALTPDEVVSIVNACIIGVIVGARLAYALFYANGYYFEHSLEIVMLSQGGMSFHGGLAGALISGYLMCRYLKLSFLSMCDLGVIGTTLGLMFGRVANFINGELWGKATDLPWGVMFSETGGGFVYRHPSQLYEAVLEGLVAFCILFVLARRKKPLYQGSYLGIFLVLYASARFLIEFVRLPDVQLGYLFNTSWLTMGQCLSIPVFICGIVVLCASIRYARPQKIHLQR